MAKAKKKPAPAKKSKTPVKKVVAKSAKKPVAKAAAKKTAKTVAKPVAKTKTKVAAKPVGKVTAKPTAKAAVKTTVVTAKPTAPKNESFFKNYLKPLDDRLVVLVGEMLKVTPGGLFIPDTVTDVSGNFQGKVMAIGRGHMNKKGKVKPLDVSVGDEVVFSQFAGSQIDVDGKNIMVIRESDVLGIVK